MLISFSSRLTFYSDYYRDSLPKPSSAVQFPWSTVLTLLGIPAVIILVWILEHTLFSNVPFGWDAFTELALPLGACIFASAVFLVPNPMHALLSLLGVFFTTVLMYLAAGIVFVGLVFLIVYVGAVAILFLFVIMLLNVKSLTSKEVLVQHLTQSAAVISAIILFQRLYTRVLTALVKALSDEHLRVGTVEPTSGEAVLLYVRYGSADINRLTTLYTLHAPNFLVITGILLVALLGAIILATVTTERATTLSDIRAYASNTSAVIVAALLFLQFFAGITTLSDLLLAINPLEDLSVVFMSYYTYKDVYHITRNKSIVKSEHNDTDKNLQIFKKAKPFRDRRFFLSRSATFCFSSKGLLVGWVRPLMGLRKLQAELLARKPRRRYKFKLWALRVKRPVKKKGRAGRAGEFLWESQDNRRAFFDGRVKIRTYVKPLKRTSTAKLYAKITKLAMPRIRTLWHEMNTTALRQRFRRSSWLWPWRSDRAVSLFRLETNSYDFSLDKNPELVLGWAARPRFTPISTLVVGPFRRLSYLYNITLFPFLYYWAWRARAFTQTFFFMLVAVPFVLVPFPWFLDDYDVVWRDLKKLYHVTNEFVDLFVLRGSYPDWAKHSLTAALLYPAAMCKIFFPHPWYVLIVAVLYAYDQVLYVGDDFGRTELHDSKCNYYRILADKDVERRLEAARQAQLRLSRRHPDRGRTDVFLLSIISTQTNTEGQLPPAFWENVYAAWRYLHRAINRSCPDLLNNPIWWPRWPVTNISVLVLPALLVYSLSSLFIILNWKRIYGNISRPSLIWPVLALFLFFYLGVLLYDRNMPLDYISGASQYLYQFEKVDSFKHFLIAVGYFTLPLTCSLVPYFIYRSLFSHYKDLAVGNMYMLRRFVNYYLRTLYDGMLSYRSLPYNELMNCSLSEFREVSAARRLLREALEEKRRAARRRFQYVFPRKIKIIYDPDPGLKTQRPTSFPYKRSPFLWPKKSQSK